MAKRLKFGAMPGKTLSVANAIALDKDLMSIGAFSIDQLMELAGLSVSQAVHRVHPLVNGPKILVACGPGNNGQLKFASVQFMLLR